MRVRRTGAERAFTLLEVLIAMSMFTVVGFAVVVLMKAGVDMWIGGNTSSQQEDRLEQSLPRLEEDARMVSVPAQADLIPFDPQNPDPKEEPSPLPAINRMVSGVHLYKIGERTVPSRYWAFVREIGPTELDAYVRRAGTSAEADAYIDGKNDEQEFKEKKHKATGGLMEVLWIYLPDEDRVGVGNLCRAFRSPIGGKDTLLEPKNHADLEVVRAKIAPEPIMSNVLYFDIWFWTEFTTSWEWTPSEPSVVQRPKAGQDGRVRVFASGPSYTWDSTRALLPKKEFKLARGPESIGFTSDDIWPRKVRVRVAVVEEHTELAKGIGEGEREFTVVSTDFAVGRGDISGHYFKIGDEWIRVSGRDVRRGDRFLVLDRGALGTNAVAHGRDNAVHYGRMMDFVLSIPSFRDDNNRD